MRYSSFHSSVPSGDGSALGNAFRFTLDIPASSTGTIQYQEWSSSNFSCSLTSHITSHSMKNLAFHSLLRLKDDSCPSSHDLTYTFLLKRLGECTFWAWDWKGYRHTLQTHAFWLSSCVSRSTFAIHEFEPGGRAHTRGFGCFWAFLLLEHYCVNVLVFLTVLQSFRMGLVASCP